MFVAVFCCIFWGLVLPLSHLIIHPVQLRPGIWRHFWFGVGVRVHIIVFNNKSVRVLCEQTGWLFINRCHRSYFHQFIRSPLLRKPILVNIPFWVAWWGSVLDRSPCSLMLLSPRPQRKLTFMSGFPRASWCSWSQHIKSSFATSRNQIQHRFRLCCDSFFTWIFLRSFRHHFRTIGITETANVKQTQKVLPFITCDISLSQYVASWFLVSMYLIRNLGSKLILSNHQSRATLWVVETCLIVGLLPFMIILITASLSSNTYIKASWREELTFEGIKSTLHKSLITRWDCFRFWMVWGGEQTSRLFINKSPRSSWLWFVFQRTATIRSHKSSAGIPSNLNSASKEMISDSVQLCGTEVCFLHIQLIGTNVWLPKTHNVPPDVDFESSRSPAKSESWNSPSLHCLAVFPT